MAKEHAEISLKGDSAGLLFLSHWSILCETTVQTGVRYSKTFQSFELTMMAVGASRCDVRIGGGGGHGKADVVREVA